LEHIAIEHCPAPSLTETSIGYGAYLIRRVRSVCDACTNLCIQFSEIIGMVNVSIGNSGVSGNDGVNLGTRVGAVLYRSRSIYAKGVRTSRTVATITMPSNVSSVCDDRARFRWQAHRYRPKRTRDCLQSYGAARGVIECQSGIG
jgi:hypothetical protein